MGLIQKFKMYRLAKYCMAVVDEAARVVNADESRESVLNALEYVQKLADQGFTPAMQLLAIVHADEQRWLYDAAQAEENWTKAAELGDIEAMYDLGMFYYAGRSDKDRDVVSGRYWMKKAADAGHPLAAKFMEARYAQ
jgi:TPR repeat protein